MDRTVSHDEIAELLGAYALDAVDADEAAAVEAHLADCPRCVAELTQHREVAALLANAGSDASAELWDRIAARLDPPGEPPPAAVVLDAALAGALPRRVTERRRRTRWSAAGAIAAAAAAVIALLAVQVGRLDDRVSTPDQQAQAALRSPGAHLVALQGTSPAAGVPGTAVAAELVIMPSGSAYVINHALPGLASDQTYQLWGLEGGGRTVSLGLLGRHPGAVALTVTDPSLIGAYAVTAERAGGVVQPSHAPVAESAPQRV
ncbi:MAG TPA: anti-sigma factor [Acidimicrobiales bacterium]|jgi:anti-sigma-K factor RskA